MCDSDPASKDYFNKHIELMKNLGQDAEYEEIQRVDDITVHKNLQKTTIY